MKRRNDISLWSRKEFKKVWWDNGPLYQGFWVTPQKHAELTASRNKTLEQQRQAASDFEKLVAAYIGGSQRAFTDEEKEIIERYPNGTLDEARRVAHERMKPSNRYDFGNPFAQASSHIFRW